MEHKASTLWNTRHQHYGTQDINIMEHKTSTLWNTRHQHYGTQGTHELFRQRNLNLPAVMLQIWQHKNIEQHSG